MRHALSFGCSELQESRDSTGLEAMKAFQIGVSRADPFRVDVPLEERSEAPRALYAEIMFQRFNHRLHFAEVALGRRGGWSHAACVSSCVARVCSARHAAALQNGRRRDSRTRESAARGGARLRWRSQNVVNVNARRRAHHYVSRHNATCPSGVHGSCRWCGHAGVLRADTESSRPTRKHLASLSATTWSHKRASEAQNGKAGYEQD